MTLVQTVKAIEVELDKSFQEREEISSNFREGVEISSN
jgi:hypothetical protein